MGPPIGPVIGLLIPRDLTICLWLYRRCIPLPLAQALPCPSTATPSDRFFSDRSFRFPLVGTALSKHWTPSDRRFPDFQRRLRKWGGGGLPLLPSWNTPQHPTPLPPGDLVQPDRDLQAPAGGEPHAAPAPRHPGQRGGRQRAGRRGLADVRAVRGGGRAPDPGPQGTDAGAGGPALQEGRGPGGAGCHPSKVK